MADLDLIPPPMPGEQRQKREGFFKKFFFKEDAPAAPHEDDEQIDLDEIKRKLGLNEPAAHQATLDAPRMDEEIDLAPEPVRTDAPSTVEIDDWTSDAHKETVSDSSWDRPAENLLQEAASEWAGERAQAEGGAHHDAVEQHLAPVMQKQDAIKEAVAQLPEPADWHLQEREVPSTQYFLLRNGQPIKSLRELIDAMEYLDDETFNHHMNEYRNDFANWIQAVIGKTDLAEAVRSAEGREQVIDILQEHKKQAAKGLATSIKQREQAVQKLEKFDSQVEDLRRKLQEKTQQLEQEKTAAAKRIKQALDKELASRLADEQKALAERSAEAERAKREAAAIHAAAEQQARELAQRESTIDDREAAVATQLAALQAEKNEAKELLKDAARVKKELAQIEAHKAQVQAQLKDIAAREKDIARKEDALKQREQKVTADITRMHEHQATLEQSQATHDERESAVKAQEAAAANLVKEAARRMQAAIEQEKKSAAAVRAETKRLEDVKRRIDGALKQMIRNKQKAMYAAQLREHLELLIKETKEGVVQERKKLEDEGFETYFDAKVATTPIGQPASHEDEDILRIKDLDIYRKIDRARQAIGQKDLATAKRLYNELRDDFQKQKLKMNEKNALYVSIRELYDDLHLAMLEQ